MAWKVLSFAGGLVVGFIFGVIGSVGIIVLWEIMPV